jgi:hypothetical protein
MPFFFEEGAAHEPGWHGLVHRPPVEWADELYQALRESELRLLCLDFDRTLIRIHTSGAYEGTTETLAAQWRETFTHVIQVALVAGTQVAVVTFSPQAMLIRALLHTVLPPEMASAVQLRTADPAEMWSGVPGLPTKQAGKLHHIASAWECCGLGDARACEWRSVLLVDDDRLNIDTAEHWGAQAVQFTPDAPDAEWRVVGDICATLRGPPASSPSACFVTPPNPGCMHHTRGFTGQAVNR